MTTNNAKHRFDSLEFIILVNKFIISLNFKIENKITIKLALDKKLGNIIEKRKKMK